jgi:hypothetical protein
VEWVKEGRKYDLGAVLITQQPGSIPVEILSQGDNWFVFHLLSEGDLNNLRKANAHFSNDILSALLNEPIPGQGVFWSSVGGTAYPVPLRVLSFEAIHSTLDPDYARPGIATYATQLRRKYSERLAAIPHVISSPSVDASERMEPEVGVVDVFKSYQQQAIDAITKNAELQTSLQGNGIPWGVVIGLLRDALPDSMDGREEVARNLVVDAINQICGGPKDSAWTTERRGTKNTLFIVKRSSGK